MNNILLIQVQPSDLNALQEIARTTFTEAYADVNTAEDMKNYLANNLSQETLLSELKHFNSRFYLAKTNEEVVGYLKLNTHKETPESFNVPTLEIERIYTLRAYYGRGVGPLLMQKAVEIAKKEGYQYIWLGVWKKNDRALQFYKKNNFQVYGERSFQLGDTLYSDYLMKKEI